MSGLRLVSFFGQRRLHAVRYRARTPRSSAPEQREQSSFPSVKGMEIIGVLRTTTDRTGYARRPIPMRASRVDDRAGCRTVRSPFDSRAPEIGRAHV